ncbi:excalibur calcium-binding domain-containing protein [Streptomyces sp. NPDC058171]
MNPLLPPAPAAPAAPAPAPQVAPAPQAAPAPQVAPAPQAPAPRAGYKNCTEARNAGAAPIYRGQDGYASHLDRDNDGIACE